MFAFAMYDKKKQQLFLARDRVGKKPLKYFFDGKRFVFASEWKALRAVKGYPSEVDFEALHHYLTMMYVPAPKTGITGIHKLPAAHSLLLDCKTGKQTLHQYWKLSYKTDHAKSVDVWKHEILELFEESVRLRMIADVPVGAFLSGGVDSAAVVAFMSKLSDHPVQTFSIGSSHAKFNELPDAQRIATQFGTDHHPIIVEPDIIHLLPDLVRCYEEPFADPSSIPTYLIARETRRHVTVALSGDGGDENFAGYVRYPIFRFSQRWSQFPSLLHVLARGGTSVMHSLLKSTFSYRCKRFEYSMQQPPAERYLQYLSFFTDEEKRRLYRSEFGKNYPTTSPWYAERTADARDRAHDDVHRAMSMDFTTYLPDDLMPKVDLGAMASTLEGRSPFLDHKLLELTAQLPTDLLIKGSQRKWILKQALSGILPEETLWKKKKGFRLPLDQWFRHELQPFVRESLREGHHLFWQMFDRQKMEAFLQHYFETSIDYSDHVWSLLWLCEWLRQYTA